MDKFPGLNYKLFSFALKYDALYTQPFQKLTIICIRTNITAIIFGNFMAGFRIKALQYFSSAHGIILDIIFHGFTYFPRGASRITDQYCMAF